jgi:two-component system sensor histidine kinase HydH
MNTGFDTLIIFLSASIFLILLFAILMFLPRLLKKIEPKEENIEINTVPSSLIKAFSTLADEIKSLKEQLMVRERLAALGEVSAGIAHEFRNPMGVIAGYAKLLLNSLEHNDKRREFAAGILKEIGDMNSIMEEMLKFSKSEPIKKAAINLSKSIEDVIQGMGENADKIEFISHSNILIKGDETLLKQTFKNLIKNALDAGDKVWIEIKRGAWSVEQQALSRESQKDGVYITVRDNGNGIAEEDLKKIFMPFYTTKQGGSGIGLALVQKIVMGHGGNITVESKEGEGSTFRIFLPME